MPYEKTVTIIVKSPTETITYRVVDAKVDRNEITIYPCQYASFRYIVTLDKPLPSADVIEDVAGLGKPTEHNLDLKVDAAIGVRIEIIEGRDKIDDVKVTMTMMSDRKTLLYEFRAHGRKTGRVRVRCSVTRTSFTVTVRR